MRKPSSFVSRESLPSCCCAPAGACVASAQVPYIEGNWKLNVQESKFPGPAPQDARAQLRST